MEPLRRLVNQFEALADKAEFQDLLKNASEAKEVEDGNDDMKFSNNDSRATSPVFHSEMMPSSGNEEVPNPEPSTSGATPPGHVECPICGIFVLEKNINAHLDGMGCKPPEEDEQKERRTKNTMKPMPMPVFHLLKDPDLRKRMKEQGLDVKGDRKALEQRLRNFIVLWNSQCDEEKPISKMEMIIQLKKEERARSSSTESILSSYNANSDPSLIDQTQTKYRQENKSSFEMLIEQARKTRKQGTANNNASKSTQETRDNHTPKRKNPPVESSTGKEHSGVDATSSGDANKSLLLASQTTSNEEVTTPKRKRLFFEPAKPAAVQKVQCPICFTYLPAIIIESHASRCLDKPELRRVATEEESGDHNESCSNLLNITPEIIEGNTSPEFVCSTPQREAAGNEINKRPRRGRRNSENDQDAANATFL